MVEIKAMECSPESCRFCSAPTIHAYFLNGYDLHYCQGCGTVGVLKPPTEDFLRNFYQGFSFQANRANLERVQTREMRNWMAGILTPHRQGAMLDFGGGGGFFAKAFEEFGLGKAFYVDLDKDSCSFAASVLGLERTFCGSLSEINGKFPAGGFDLIICRHVIEHLIDPPSVVLRLAEMLSDNGVLVLSCPNGSSKEGVFYPAYWNSFLDPVVRENGWSRPYGLLFSLTKMYGWGISPPRHLWAITGKALQHIVERDGRYSIKIESASLANKIYSPYWRSSGAVGKIRDSICNKVFGGFFEGMHLIAHISRVQPQLKN